MFNKKALSLAVAAAASGLSVGAMAQIDITAGTDRVLIANETVTPLTTGVLPVGTNGAPALDITSELGIGVANNDQIFIRYDFSSAEFAGDLAVTDITVGAESGTGLTNGQTGDSTAIFGVLAPGAGFPQDAAVTLLTGTGGAPGLQLIGTTTDVRVRVFETQAAAINELVPLSDQSLSGAVALGNALSFSFSPQNATAEVTTNFTEFVGGATTAELGSFTVAGNTNFVEAANLTDVLADATNIADFGTSSIVTYSGDFSFATGPNAYFVSAGTGCNFGAAVTIDTSTLATATAEVGVANGESLCVTVTGDETIPEASFTASANVRHLVTTSSPNNSTGEGAIGDIDRNGTTVEVAYLTTFSDYNQRLLINSRHPVPAEYTVTFQTEDGVTATALPAASGVLQPGENLVLRATDIVELTGGTRCSATVVVVAPEGNISVATTQVNLSDASTDTVSYN
jgi:hypothetical protein